MRRLDRTLGKEQIRVVAHAGPMLTQQPHRRRVLRIMRMLPRQNQPVITQRGTNNTFRGHRLLHDPHLRPMQFHRFNNLIGIRGHHTHIHTLQRALRSQPFENSRQQCHRSGVRHHEQERVTRMPRPADILLRLPPLRKKPYGGTIERLPRSCRGHISTRMPLKQRCPQALLKLRDPRRNRRLRDTQLVSRNRELPGLIHRHKRLKQREHTGIIPPVILPGTANRRRVHDAAFRRIPVAFNDVASRRFMQ